MDSLPSSPLYLDTTPGMFAAWLSQRTQGLSSERYPTELGWITLQGLPPIAGFVGGVIGFPGTYLAPGSKPDSTFVQPIGAVVQFVVTPVSADRIEVLIRCDQRTVAPFVAWIIGEMARAWPGSDAAQLAARASIPAGSTPEQSPPPPIAGLSERDTKIVNLWREGMTAADIGYDAHISEQRVRNIINDLRKAHGDDAIPYHRKKSVYLGR